jgi:hypothetical protein
MRFPIAAFSLLLLAGGASAQTDAPATPPKTVKIICVRGEADTGSHFGARKTCHTQEEWDMIHEQSARSLQRYETIQNSQQQNDAGR